MMSHTDRATLMHVPATISNSEIERKGNFKVVGRYPIQVRGGRFEEVTVEGRGVNCCEAYWKMVPCLRVTMFGVEQDVKNADIARECKVEVVGCHLSGNHYSLTKDITVDLRPESKLTRLSDFCRQWKSVSVTAERRPNKNKNCKKNSNMDVVMLQVVIPEHVRLTDADKESALAEYLTRTKAEYIKYNSHGATCVTPPADPTELTKNAIYTFFITCPKKTALSYTQLSRPFMDAHPLRVESGGTVYLHTVQLCRKPDVYKPTVFKLPVTPHHGSSTGSPMESSLEPSVTSSMDSPTEDVIGLCRGRSTRRPRVRSSSAPPSQGAHLFDLQLCCKESEEADMLMRSETMCGESYPFAEFF